MNWGIIGNSSWKDLGIVVGKVVGIVVGKIVGKNWGIVGNSSWKDRKVGKFFAGKFFSSKKLSHISIFPTSSQLQEWFTHFRLCLPFPT